MKVRSIPAIMTELLATARDEAIEKCAKVADLAGDEALSDAERAYATLIAKNIRKLKGKK